MSELMLQSAVASAQAPAGGQADSGLLSEAQKTFASLFARFVADGYGDLLFEFIKQQPLDELDSCLKLYFVIDLIVAKRDRSSQVFARFAEQLAERHVSAALLVGSLTRGTRPLWPAHFQELGGDDRTRVDQAVAKQHAKLPAARRTFVKLYMTFMTDPNEKLSDLVAHIEKLKAKDQQACVRLYGGLSTAFETSPGERTLDVFWPLSFFALAKGRSTYAAEYGKMISDPGNNLYAHFQALPKDRQTELRETINDAKVVDDPKPGSRPGQSKLPPLSEAQEAYVKCYRAYVDDGNRDQLAALKSGFKGLTGDALAALVAIYLHDSVHRYRTTVSARSLEVFFETLYAALERAESFYAYKVKSYVEAKDGVWKTRYDALISALHRDRLRARIDERIKAKRFIDDLKIAFWLANNWDPKPAELRAFSPLKPGPVTEALDRALGDIDVGVGAASFEILAKGYRAVAAAINAEQEPMARWMLAKRILDRSEPTVRYRHMAYLQAVGLIYLACIKRYDVQYANGFDMAEMGLFYEVPGRDVDRYFYDLAIQISDLIAKRSARADGSDDDAYTARALAEASMILAGDRLRLALCPPLAAASVRGAVEQAWEKDPQRIASMRIRVDGGRAGRADLKIGQTVGNVYILWWDGKTAYLMVNGYGDMIFEADAGRLGEIYDFTSLYHKLKEDTAHLAVVIPFFFQVLGYIPDLVTGGLSGLAKSILFDVVFDKSVEILGINPTEAQVLVFGASLLLGGKRPKQVTADIAADAAMPHRRRGGVGEAPRIGAGQQLGPDHLPGSPAPRAQHLDVSDPRARHAPIDDAERLASGNGYDPRGARAADGGNVIGVHDTSVTTHSSGSTPVAGQRETGTRLGATDPAPPRRSYQHQGLQQQQTKRATDVDETPKLTPDQRAARKEYVKETSVQSANERRIEAAKRGQSKEAHLDGRVVSGGTQQRKMDILGNKQRFDASRRNGYQVYMFKDNEGRVVYVGLSGRTLESGSGRTQLADWRDRLMDSHVNSQWLENANKLEVVSDLTYAEMNLLEQRLIHENLGKSWNFNKIANPEAAKFLKDEIPDMIIHSKGRTDQFDILFTDPTRR